MKLSPRQTEVIKHMQDGYELTTFGCFSGHVTWVNLNRLRKEIPDENMLFGKRQIEIHISDATVGALRNRGLIELPDPKGMDHLNIWVLTEKGKELKLE